MGVQEAGQGLVRVGHRNRAAHFSLTGIVVFVGCILLGMQVAVQYFALKVGYQAILGEPLFHAGRHGVYPFWWWLKWSVTWGGKPGVVGDLVLGMQMCVVGGSAAALGVGYFVYYRRSMKREKVEDLHGSARFAAASDVLRMGLAPAKKDEAGRGPYLGAYEFGPNDIRMLRYDGDAHIGAGAPTRSGKGVGLVLPTLLTYPYSTATNDIKKENWELTAGFRHRAGSLCIPFEPTNFGGKSIDGRRQAQATCRWNVLEEIRIGTIEDVKDAQNIAAAIADPDGKGMDDHWVSTSYELLTGLFLHMVYFERDKSLAGAATYLADPTFTDPEQMFNRMLNAEHDPDGSRGWVDSMGNPTKTHPAVAIAARAMLNKEEKERNSVLSTAKTRLALFTEPIVARNTAVSDFKVKDLMNHDKPVSFYLIVPPSDKDRLRPLLRLFITYTLRRLTEEMRFEDGGSAKSYLHRLLMMLDELPSLRKLDCIQDGLAYVAGYGIQLYLIFQDTVQVKEAYGDKESVVAGLQVKVFYAPNKAETAEEISKMTGKTTVSKQEVSYSGSRNGVMLNQMSISEQQVERPLMTPDEVGRLSRDESLIIVTGEPPIRAKKIRYFQIPEFKRRAKMAPPARIGYTCWSEERGTDANWLMLSADRDEGGMRLKAWINVYREYPPVRVVVKQIVLQTGEILSIPAVLLGANGQEWNGPLPVDEVEYSIVPASGTAFDPLEAFEIHVELVAPPFPGEFEEMGFFSALSVYERDARDKARQFYAEERNESKVSFDRVGRNMVCRGTVVMETDRCIILERDHDALSVHRKDLLDRECQIGARVVVKYGPVRGTVEVRA